MSDTKSIIKVDSYDFFGYLIPGAVVTFSIFICVTQVLTTKSLSDLCVWLWDNVENIHTERALTVLLLFIIASYILGHVTGSLSSFIFERTIIDKILLYPYKSLVFNEPAKHDFSSNSYRALISLIFIFITLIILGITEPKIHFIFETPMPPCSIVGLFILILMVCKIFDEFLKRHIKFFYKIFHPLLNIIYIVTAIPFRIFERFSFHFLGQVKHFPPEVRNRIISQHKKIFNYHAPESIGAEFFWSTYWFMVNRNAFVRARLDKWLILYSFMRNMSCATLLAAIIIVLPIRILHLYSLHARIFSLLLFALSLLFSLRYYYLYFGYYSKNLFRSFVFTNPEQEDEAAD